jgi:DNA-binding beta-propeller fold protein YncE
VTRKISFPEVNVSKLRVTTLAAVLVALTMSAWAQEKAPLVLAQTIPLPGLKDGDFDHFFVDLPSNRLFLTAEENSAVEIFDLRTNKLIHTISDVKAPHSMFYRADLNKLFVVDGEAAEVKIYNGDSYNQTGSIKLLEDADSSLYDPSTKYLYVVNGGKDAKMTSTMLSIIDTTTDKKVGDIKLDSDSLEAMAIEKSGPRLFINVTGKDHVAAIDREKRKVIATWPTGQVAKHLVAMSFDEADHRLFVTTRTPGKLIVLDSESGKVVTSLPCVGMNDDMAYDPANKRIYVAGSGFLDVFQQKDADHYEQIGHVAGAFRAKTAILVPQLNSYYLAVPHHGAKEAAVRVYKVQP